MSSTSRVVFFSNARLITAPTLVSCSNPPPPLPPDDGGGSVQTQKSMDTHAHSTQPSHRPNRSNTATNPKAHQPSLKHKQYANTQKQPPNTAAHSQPNFSASRVVFSSNARLTAAAPTARMPLPDDGGGSERTQKSMDTHAHTPQPSQKPKRSNTATNPKAQQPSLKYKQYTNTRKQPPNTAAHSQPRSSDCRVVFFSNARLTAAAPSAFKPMPNN